MGFLEVGCALWGKKEAKVIVMKTAHHFRVFFPQINTDSVIRKKKKASEKYNSVTYRNLT